ncbi:MAG: hypothetical protein Q7S33_05740 [Nanoarchaeota archaeon]|nr:hypothetical protein [Nanoarchaeota archaeon]
MRWFFKFKYPKLAILFLTIVLSYYIFQIPGVVEKISSLETGSIGIFVAGMLFSFGFSAPLAIGFFITLNPSNIFLTAVIAGLGAMASNLLIFQFVKFSFMDEFKRLEKTKTIKRFDILLEETFHGHIRRYLLYAFVGFLIMAPISDEIAVAVLVGTTKIKESIFAVIAFILSTLGIFLILLL